MRDGVELAATLYLPVSTSSTTEGALDHRRRGAAVPAGGAALPQGRPHLVVRRDLRSGCATSSGTRSAGSTCGAPGRATATPPTSTRPPSRRTSLEVIAWLADQPWCNGNVGMFGTSYSGFNSLQLACERPPALKAVCAIYSSDDRWTDDVHYRGRRAEVARPRRLLPLHDADDAAAARARGVRRRLARRVAAAAGDPGALGADLAAARARTATTGGTGRCAAPTAPATSASRRR